MASPVGIYLAVPFCKAKCSFCNFASDAFAPARMDAYVEKLCAEIRGAREAAGRMGAELPREADTVYFGGGTPSLLAPEMFREIFAALREEFSIELGAEMTIECAPGQLEDSTLDELLRQGVNRVSLGVQTFVDGEARAVGRLHTGAECEREIARLKCTGVASVGLDLIAGLPYQTRTTWRESADRAIACGVEHVSVYMLEVDDGSRLGRESLRGGARYGAGALPSEDETAEFYEMGCKWLHDAGIGQYEISNFAREGFRSRHNTRYWRRQPYVGFGLDAHSMLAAKGGAVRFENTDEFEEYMRPRGPLTMMPREPRAPEFIGREAAFEESLFLGLRMNEGVDLVALREEFGAMLDGAMGAVDEICAAGLLELEGERVRLTARGRMASNEVFSRLLVPAVV